MEREWGRIEVDFESFMTCRPLSCSAPSSGSLQVQRMDGLPSYGQGVAGGVICSSRLTGRGVSDHRRSGVEVRIEVLLLPGYCFAEKESFWIRYPFLQPKLFTVYQCRRQRYTPKGLLRGEGEATRWAAGG